MSIFYVMCSSVYPTAKTGHQMNGAIHQEKQLLAGGMLFALGHSHH
jgi:hypothetical protein